MLTNTNDNMNLEDFIKCYICMGKLVEATMCPHCNKLSCQKCIQKWLAERKSTCPFCRMSLKYTQIVNCRFINEITNMIETISSKKSSNENCPEHKIPLLYYCIQCLEPLCSDCFMFGKKHKDHEIKHLDIIYKNHLELIKNETKDLQSKLDNLNNILLNIEEKISLIKHAKQERSLEQDELFDNLKKKLDSIMREKLLSLIKTKTVVSDKIDEFEKKKSDINKKLSDSNHSALIANSQEYIKILRSLGLDNDIFKDSLNVSVVFESEISPPYESTIFNIKDYKKMLSSSTSKDTIYSTELLTNGLVWRLKIYPNGNGVAKGEYISIFLELIEGLSENSKYFYKIELFNFLENKTNYSREFSSDFHNGECWGYNRFYKIDLLEKEGFIDPLTGNLNLKFYVRPLTYSQLCRDQKLFIDKIEKQIKQQSEINKKNKENELISKKIVNEKETQNIIEKDKLLSEINEENKNIVEENKMNLEEIKDNKLDVIDYNNIFDKNEIKVDSSMMKENVPASSTNNINDLNLRDLNDSNLNRPEISQNNIVKLENQKDNKEIDEGNILMKSANLPNSQPSNIFKEKDIQKCISEIDNVFSKNKEIDEAIFVPNERKFLNSNKKTELNFIKNSIEQKPKRDFFQEIENDLKHFTAIEDEKYDFVQLLDQKDISLETGQNNIQKQNFSSEVSSDLFDKANNDDSFNLFKENIKSNLDNNNFNLKQEYEDPFSKKLNLKNNIGFTSRKESHTENRINDMMASLFPENSQRTNSRTKPGITSVENQNLYPSSSTNCSIFEKNKFNNYEKLRYILKENKLKSTKKK